MKHSPEETLSRLYQKYKAMNEIQNDMYSITEAVGIWKE